MESVLPDFFRGGAVVVVPCASSLLVVLAVAGRTVAPYARVAVVVVVEVVAGEATTPGDGKV